MVMVWHGQPNAELYARQRGGGMGFTPLSILVSLYIIHSPLHLSIFSHNLINEVSPDPTFNLLIMSFISDIVFQLIMTVYVVTTVLVLNRSWLFV